MGMSERTICLSLMHSEMDDMDGVAVLISLRDVRFGSFVSG